MRERRCGCKISQLLCIPGHVIHKLEIFIGTSASTQHKDAQYLVITN